MTPAGEEEGRHPRVTAGLEAFERYRWTNALLAVDEGARPSSRGPLAGMVFSAKDVFLTKRLPSTGGSLVLEGYRSTRDATAVSRAERAGAALLAKSNCAEFGIGIHTSTRIGGRVEHPFDRSISPGGSSGGDAVAVATGMVDFALAADYGGSVRWPAQAVGVCGLRTSLGLVPRSGAMPGTGASSRDPSPAPPAPWTLRGQLEVVGLLARRPSLIARALAAIASPDELDWLAIPAGRVLSVSHKRRLAFTYGDEIAPVGQDSRAAVEHLVETARTAGYEVAETRGSFGNCLELYNELRAGLDDTTDIERLVAGKEDLCCEATRALLGSPPPRGPADSAVRDAWAESRHRVAGLRRLLVDFDAIALPVAPVKAVAFEGAATVEGRELRTPAELMAHNRAVSLTGLPSLSVPVPAASGVQARASVQLVGPHGGDWLLCAIAEELFSPNDD